jgi:hypothetical protein
MPNFFSERNNNMKTVFSEYDFEIKKLAKKLAKHSSLKLNPLQIVSWVNDNKDLIFKEKPEYLEKTGYVRSLQNEHIAYKGCPHYFITGKDMDKWLSESAPKLDEEKIDIIKSEQEEKIFFLHFEGRESPCYLVAFYKDQNGEMTMSVTSGQKRTPLIVDLPKTLWDYINVNEELKKPFNIVASFIAYLQCFPETVSKGIPESMKDSIQFNNTGTAYIGEPYYIDTFHIQTNRTVKPHPRIGHFRFLKSEYFVNKRWQYVPVKGTYIKGEPETVLSIEDYDKKVA